MGRSLNRKFNRLTNDTQAVKDGETAVVSNEEFESNGIQVTAVYPSASAREPSLNFGQVSPYQQQIKEEPPVPQQVATQQQTVAPPQQQQITTPQQQPHYTLEKQVPTSNGDTLFSTQEIEYEYKEELITNATEIDSISDSDFLLEYVYDKEKEVGATLLVEAYGVSDHIFENSDTHEIIVLGGERYFSNKTATLDKDKLDLLLADIAKALSTVGFFDLPLIKKHTFSGKDEDIKCIKAMSINTFEYNAIMGLQNSFNTMNSVILEKEGNLFMRFQKE